MPFSFARGVFAHTYTLDKMLMNVCRNVALGDAHAQSLRIIALRISLLTDLQKNA